MNNTHISDCSIINHTIKSAVSNLEDGYVVFCHCIKIEQPALIQTNGKLYSAAKSYNKFSVLSNQDNTVSLSVDYHQFFDLYPILYSHIDEFTLKSCPFHANIQVVQSTVS